MMSMDTEHGCWEPGKNGKSVHHGEPLTVEQIRELPDGAEVIITWSGGNGPWPYRILVDTLGERRIENLHPDTILKWPGQAAPLHRVTLGWDNSDRAWATAKTRREPPHIHAEWARLRGEPARRASCPAPSFTDGIAARK